jgi:hypothetical protein
MVEELQSNAEAADMGARRWSDEDNEAPISLGVLPPQVPPSIATGDVSDDAMVVVHSLVAETTHPFLGGSRSSISQ